MNNKEIFLTFWKNLKEDMVSSLNHHIEMYNRLDHANIQKLYSDKLLRWDTHMSPEGQWLLPMNDAKAEEVKKRISNLQLTVVKPQGSKSSDNLLLYGAIGAVAGYVVGMVIPVVLGETLLAVAGAGVGIITSNKQSKAKKQQELEYLRNAYIKQIVRHGEEIAQIWG